MLGFPATFPHLVLLVPNVSPLLPGEGGGPVPREVRVCVLWLFCDFVFASWHLGLGPPGAGGVCWCEHPPSLLGPPLCRRGCLASGPHSVTGRMWLLWLKWPLSATSKQSHFQTLSQHLVLVQGQRAFTFPLWVPSCGILPGLAGGRASGRPNLSLGQVTAAVTPL